jgi:hypothetical protein
VLLPLHAEQLKPIINESGDIHPSEMTGEPQQTHAGEPFVEDDSAGSHESETTVGEAPEGSPKD